MRILLATLVMVTGTAHAGAYLEMSHVDLTRPKDRPTISKFWAQAGRARAETSGDRGQYTIFRDEQMFIVEPKQRSYRVMDKATMEAMGRRMADMRRQMEARMAKMPPEQRAAMQRMMNGAVPGAVAAVAKRQVQATSRTEAAGGRSCRVWEIYESGAKDEELCVVPPGSLPGGDEFFAAMKNMASMTERMTKAMGGQAGRGEGNYFQELKRINGIPVLTRDFQNGRPTHETRMNVVRRESVPDAAFEVPAGFKRLGMGPGTGGED